MRIGAAHAVCSHYRDQPLLVTASWGTINFRDCRTRTRYKGPDVKGRASPRTLTPVSWLMDAITHSISELQLAASTQILGIAHGRIARCATLTEMSASTLIGRAKYRVCQPERLASQSRSRRRSGLARRIASQFPHLSFPPPLPTQTILHIHRIQRFRRSRRSSRS